MARHNPFTLQLQVSRLFADGQGFFASIKVQEWLKARGEDPKDYEIGFRKAPAQPGSGQVESIAIVLKRKDDQPLDPLLAADINQM
jgi:hypothetical protein